MRAEALQHALPTPCLRTGARRTSCEGTAPLQPLQASGWGDRCFHSCWRGQQESADSPGAAAASAASDGRGLSGPAPATHACRRLPSLCSPAHPIHSSATTTIGTASRPSTSSSDGAGGCTGLVGGPAGGLAGSVGAILCCHSAQSPHNRPPPALLWAQYLESERASARGHKLFTVAFLPDADAGPPAALLCWHHGVAEHIGRYKEGAGRQAP